MKRIFVVCLLFAPLIAQTVAKREGAAALLDADRLQIREAQLVLAQAHIARLQAEVTVKEQESVIQAHEKRLTDLLESLKKQYACAECELNADFTWARKPAPSKPATPAPEGGQSQKKE